MATLNAEQIVKMLNGTDPKERFKAVKIIEKIKNEKLMDLCAARIKTEKVVQVITAIIELLGESKNSKYYSLLETLAAMSNPEISEAAQKYTVNPEIPDEEEVLSFDDLLLADDGDGGLVLDDDDGPDLPPMKPGFEESLLPPMKPEFANAPPPPKPSAKKSEPKPVKAPAMAPAAPPSAESYSFDDAEVERLIQNFVLNEDGLIDDEPDEEFESIVTFSDKPVIDSVVVDAALLKGKKNKAAGKKSPKALLYLVLFLLLAGAGGGAYYYFMVLKPKTAKTTPVKKPAATKKAPVKRPPRPPKTGE